MKHVNFFFTSTSLPINLFAVAIEIIAFIIIGRLILKFSDQPPKTKMGKIANYVLTFACAFLAVFLTLQFTVSFHGIISKLISMIFNH